MILRPFRCEVDTTVSQTCKLSPEKLVKVHLSPCAIHTTIILSSDDEFGATISCNNYC